MQQLLSFRIRILNTTRFQIERNGRQEILGNILKVNVLLRFHQSSDIIFIQCVLSPKMGQKLQVEFNHFEVDEFGLQ